MENLPKKIYLNIGSDQSVDFKDLSEVTWSQDRIGKDCVEYVLASPPPMQSIEEAAEKANGYSVYGKGGDKYNAFNEGFLAGAEHQARQQPRLTQILQLCDNLPKEANYFGTVDKIKLLCQ